MMISGGFNIYPGEIERVLAEHESVLEVGVVSKPNKLLGDVPVAFVRLRNSSDLSDVRDFCASHLESYKRPELRLLEKMPLTGVGKPDKQALRALVVEGESSNGRREVVGELEMVPEEVLELELESLGIKAEIAEDLWEAGLDSLGVVALVDALEKRTGVAIDPARMFGVRNRKEIVALWKRERDRAS